MAVHVLCIQLPNLIAACELAQELLTVHPCSEVTEAANLAQQGTIATILHELLFSLVPLYMQVCLSS